MSGDRARVTLCLSGDLMPGRGVDQILPHAGDPALREPSVRDARSYVRMAESHSGAIDPPVGFAWPWGDALDLMDEARPDARVVNVESSMTDAGVFAPGKPVHYRMSRANVPAIAVGRPDVCVLANNHVLDFGTTGLTDTLDTLSSAGLRWAGAGHDAEQAFRPAAVPARDGGRILVLAGADTSSGVPPDWAATADAPGVHVLPDLSRATAARLADRLRAARLPGDVTMVSIHWGSNWGYHVPDEHVRFAHQLIDHGVDLVHGHSSHHPRPVELYRGKLVLYGCGDFIDDYEGISGHERYRDDLRPLYFPEIDPDTGELARMRVSVTQARRMRLHRASRSDVHWMRSTLSRISGPFGARVELGSGDAITVEPV